MKFNIRMKILVGFVSIAAILLIVGIMTIILTSELSRLNFVASKVETPLIDAAMEVKILGTEAHLIFEEVLSGDVTEDIQGVWDLLDESLWYCDAVLKGGTKGNMTYLATRDSKVMEDINGVKEDIDVFIQAAKVRYENRTDATGIGSETDQQFDRLYMGIQKELLSIQKLFTQRKDFSGLELVADTRYILANAHLELEEFLSGDVVNAGSDIIRELKQAHESGKQIKLLAGNSGSGDLVKNLEEFSILAGTRIEAISSLDKTVSEADIKFDDSFHTFMSNIDIAEEDILKAIEKANNDVTTIVQVIMVMIITAISLALILAVIIGLVLSGNIAKPLIKVVEMSKEIAGGNLALEKLDIKSKDEIGMLADSFHTMLDSLNELLSQVNAAVDQVASGSDQISKSSQSLSQGASEQASSLEEISSSINEIAGQSNQNAENAIEANSLAKKATENAESGNNQMKSLVESMQKISQSSDEIKKVVKVIDDIAFQINLLALNANVEAARAGKYGKGFAVVAEEVRNLAVKSASSVKETTKMVEESLKNIELGNDAAELTAKQLEDIVTGSSKVANLVEEIASACREQAQGIEQINQGLEQVDQVTQENTANAEESASASEELASQGQQLRALIMQFKLAKSNGRGKTEKDNVSQEALHKLVQVELKKIQQHQQTYLPAQQKKKAKKSKSGKTGVDVVDPKKVIKLDDDDFGKF